MQACSLASAAADLNGQLPQRKLPPRNFKKLKN
jgi:hypothetical protein